MLYMYRFRVLMRKASWVVPRWSPPPPSEPSAQVSNTPNNPLNNHLSNPIYIYVCIGYYQHLAKDSVYNKPEVFFAVNCIHEYDPTLPEHTVSIGDLVYVQRYHNKQVLLTGSSNPFKRT